MDSPDEIYAVKVLETNTRKDRLLAEVSIMEKLNHPNLIFFIEAFQSVGYLYIVMELQIGDLKKAIDSLYFVAFYEKIFNPSCIEFIFDLCPLITIF